MKLLDIDKLRDEFKTFFSLLQTMEEGFKEKIQKVDILYEEVDAGFVRNARDRSDYLVHYERINGLMEGSIGLFRD